MFDKPLVEGKDTYSIAKQKVIIKVLYTLQYGSGNIS